MQARAKYLRNIRVGIQAYEMMLREYLGDGHCRLSGPQIPAVSSIISDLAGVCGKLKALEQELCAATRK